MWVSLRDDAAIVALINTGSNPGMGGATISTQAGVLHILGGWQVRIDTIEIGHRQRKDLGDVAGLARSIADVGLLHPVVVTPDGRLIAGLRRIAACRLLGWDDVPVTVVNLEALLYGERDENVVRKDFAPTEAVALGKELEPMEREAARERYEATRPGVAENFTTTEKGRALDKVAAVVGMSRPTYEKAKAVVEAAETDPERYAPIAEKMDSTGNVNGAHKAMAALQRQEERAALATTVAEMPKDARWHIEEADMRTFTLTERVDFVITDPPYPREHLDLYGILAERALEWLKPTGLLLAMCGQSYLNQIMQMMSAHLEYYWTGCYLTPGAPTPLRHRQVNTTWKPILVLGLPGASYKGKIFGDVWTSDASDKEHHHWGQSESGMLAMIRQVCLPGQSIFDPFCGAGTTGLAALQHGCTFVGIDIDRSPVEVGAARLLAWCND